MPDSGSTLVIDHASPVTMITPDAGAPAPADGIALCLSGGGYRAMLFHLGVLLRLNEAGMLGTIDRISSVSGGSVAAATLGLCWSRLGFDDNGVAGNLVKLVVDPVRNLASHTIDTESVMRGLFLRGSIAGRITKAYDKYLFHGATLRDLPDDASGPRFVINAANVQTGNLWRFSRPYMGDYEVGRVFEPDTSLAVAVAASSAFPPFLSPATLKLDPTAIRADPECPLQRPPFTTEILLTDGGIYDNLGLETAWKRYKTLLVSDAGGQMQPGGEPHKDWARHMKRVLDLIDNQVRDMRKRQLVGSFKNPYDPHHGAYWSIRCDVNAYDAPNTLDCPHSKTLALANTPTRLEKLSSSRQEKLINWGYAVSDAALRKYFDTKMKPPQGFPYPIGV